jgi:hypothetical protein
MSARDEMWVDMTQFDHQAADGLWDGTHRDPDAPPWYRDLRSLIHRARGPAETHELLDEPLVVDTMHRVRMGSSISRLPHSPRVRTLGRILAMKAAAATTASMIGIATAAAATTGIVAIAATTVVMPVVTHQIVPMINQHIAPKVVRTETAPAPATSSVPPHHVTAAPELVIPREPVTPAEPLAAHVAEGTAVTPAADAAAKAEAPPTDPAVADPPPADPVVTDPPPADPVVDPEPEQPPVHPPVVDHDPEQSPPGDPGAPGDDDDQGQGDEHAADAPAPHADEPPADAGAGDGLTPAG